ncbi:MAG: hypothetical protein HC846_02215 [Blastocatellia bacterium]|nr:hypothetical protein [Blastocatellia bacterium]
MNYERKTIFRIFRKNFIKCRFGFQNRNCSERIEEWEKELQKFDPDFEMFSEARKVLLEFGGIKVNRRDSGIDFAREPFEIDLLLGIGESDRFSVFEAEIGEKLYPLGEGGGNHYFLAIGESGKVYGLMGYIFLIGNTFDDALENLILGRKPKE